MRRGRNRGHRGPASLADATVELRLPPLCHPGRIPPTSPPKRAHTDSVPPGDVVTIDGVFLPQRTAESGYCAMMAKLVAAAFIEAQKIIVHEKAVLSEEERTRLDAQIDEIARAPPRS
ncbi:hypothetical protein ACHAWF_012020 [Thalassiosira exigua]